MAESLPRSLLAHKESPGQRDEAKPGLKDARLAWGRADAWGRSSPPQAAGVSVPGGMRTLRLYSTRSRTKPSLPVTGDMLKADSPAREMLDASRGVLRVIPPEAGGKRELGKVRPTDVGAVGLSPESWPVISMSAQTPARPWGTPRAHPSHNVPNASASPHSRSDPPAVLPALEGETSVHLASFSDPPGHATEDPSPLEAGRVPLPLGLFPGTPRLSLKGPPRAGQARPESVPSDEVGQVTRSSSASSESLAPCHTT